MALSLLRTRHDFFLGPPVRLWSPVRHVANDDLGCVYGILHMSETVFGIHPFLENTHRNPLSDDELAKKLQHYFHNQK
ncbi:hypothetical protein J2736_000394 [Paenibacillus qinlingensis]|uniref:Uncharacterized protein n=1 Tax=Paenibacillus qinlingensis TaxID=1837343 RepID=A0ABU1NP09_9BACL|nr:hypothetical protein [Paenibacillus qinlingensis]